MDPKHSGADTGTCTTNPRQRFSLQKASRMSEETATVKKLVCDEIEINSSLHATVKDTHEYRAQAAVYSWLVRVCKAVPEGVEVGTAGVKTNTGHITNALKCSEAAATGDTSPQKIQQRPKPHMVSPVHFVLFQIIP